jgi:hypothetical protein
MHIAMRGVGIALAAAVLFAAPPRAEAMYEPEVSGRGTGATITVTTGR